MGDPTLPSTPFWVTAASKIIRSLPAGRYRAVQLLPQAGGRFWARLPPELGGLAFQCDLRDALMREVCLTGRYEPQETSLMQNLLGRGDTFVDVGANWGYFTLVGAALVGPAGRVLSVEADPRACRVIRENVARNRLRHVLVTHAAAHDSESVLSLKSYEPTGDESSSFGVSHVSITSIASARHFDVPARPLDTLLGEAALERINLLKMDIEGGEAPALDGLTRCLSEQRVDRILLELHPLHLERQGHSAFGVVRALQAHGYRAWRIDHTSGAYRRAAMSAVPAASLLAPLSEGSDLGTWPHLLWARAGLPPTVDVALARPA